MSKQHYLMQDQGLCIGCLSCQLHCRANKNLPAGPKPGQIVTIGPKHVGGQPRSAYVFMACFHCDTPWCVTACPTGAMVKREEDGLVYVQDELCVGCKACIIGCPFGAVQWNPVNLKAVKCDFCKDRIDQGMEPACVSNCTTKCLSFGNLTNLAKAKRLISEEDLREYEPNTSP